MTVGQVSAKGCLQEIDPVWLRTFIAVMEVILRNSFLLSVVFLSTVALTAPSVAQNANSGMPRDPTTKAGKCAKAHGGTWNARRNGWYTRDRLNYNKCMAS